jgi:2-hydroxychromene-2-carboxylate isomerase
MAQDSIDFWFSTGSTYAFARAIIREQNNIPFAGRARKLGIFGAPAFAVGGELCRGDGRLDDAICWLRHGRLQA